MNAKERKRLIGAIETYLPMEYREPILRALRLLAAAEGGEGTADIAGLVEALGHQRQCDEDGVMCIVSRQAVDEARTQIAALAARVAELEPDAERYATMRRAILNDFNGLKFLQYMHWPLDTFDAAGGFDAAIDAASAR